MSQIRMVDLHTQYLHIRGEVDAAIQQVIDQSAFINGPQVEAFAQALAAYTGAKYVIPCANGTDALQISLMALGLQPGDEVIVPAFTYVATAEVIGLLHLVPVMTDVDPHTFNMTAEVLEQALTPRTRAIVPVHLFGQSCDMAPILDFARQHGLFVVEDNAQALGAVYSFPDGTRRHTGTMGHIGCTSFFPSKNLGCFGDGGAMMTDDPELARLCRSIANHGQEQKYHHSLIGCNSRLDTLQAAVLNVKLKYLDQYARNRALAAERYDALLRDVPGVVLPWRSPWSTHVFHQYTLQVAGGRRDALKEYLAARQIPSMIYYPLPLQEQQAFRSIARPSGSLDVAAQLCRRVLSLPMHTELTEAQQEEVARHIVDFSE